MSEQKAPYFEIVNAAGRRQLVLRTEPLTIGRHAENRLVVQDDMASRFHCVIERTTGGYFLRDLGASNGTLVNGRRVKSAMLSPGDVVTIGRTSLVLVMPDKPMPGGVDGAIAKAKAGAANAATPPKPAGPARAARGSVPLNDPIPLDDEPIPLDDPVPLDALDELARPAPGTEVEELSELDVVADEGEALEGGGWGGPAGPGADDDRIHVEQDDAGDTEDSAMDSLRIMAEQIPSKPFSDRDIVLINPRGQVVHSGASAAPAGAPPQAVDLFRVLLLVAFRGRATDIHIEPKDGSYLARVRVDGVMVDAARMPSAVGTRLVALVKVLCELDPSQKSIIQEGNFSARVPAAGTTAFGRAPAGGAGGAGGAGTRRVDYRVSFAPAVSGQKLVLRVLDPTTVPAHLSDLALPRTLEEELADAVQQDSGMVLVSGPTGSGKTSTLYALVRSIDTSERNVITIEDPVEIHLAGATQMPVDESKGNSFPALLRSVLRQDPDVILVGEVRDAETARIAMQAAITGHLVFSTIHTKDTLGTIFRLLDLGVEPFMLSQGLHMILAQRLVRKLCPFCKGARPVTEAQLDKMGEVAEGVTRVYTPTGCRKCLGTGHSGRRAFFEFLRANDELRDAISRSPGRRELQEALTRTSFERLSHAGYRLVAEGVCAFEEIERVVGR